MIKLQEIMTKMLTNPYYKSHHEARETMCDICRAILNDDFYEAVHIVSDKVNSIKPTGLYVPEWRMKQYEEFTELSKAISDVFVTRMEQSYGVY